MNAPTPFALKGQAQAARHAQLDVCRCTTAMPVVEERAWQATAASSGSCSSFERALCFCACASCSARRMFELGATDVRLQALLRCGASRIVLGLLYFFHITGPGHLDFVHSLPCEGTNPYCPYGSAVAFCSSFAVTGIEFCRVEIAPTSSLFGMAGVAGPDPGKLRQAVERGVTAAINDSLLEASSLEVHCLKQQCCFLVQFPSTTCMPGVLLYHVTQA